MPRQRRWTDEQLRTAVAVSSSYAAVCTQLSLRPGGGTYAILRKHIDRLGIDNSHFRHRTEGRTGPRRSWTDDDLSRAAAASSTLAEVQRRLGFRPSGGMHRFLKAHLKRLSISTEHFLGQGWARGQRHPGGYRARPLNEILVRESGFLSTAGLRKRLITAGLKLPICEHCGLDTWRGERLPLALDHVNGDTRDNRIENLRVLCPNCHSLTDTWCGRKNGRRTPTGSGTPLQSVPAVGLEPTLAGF